MIEDVRKMVFDMIEFTWPMIAISVVILISLRISHLIKNKQKFIFYKEMLMLIFIVYILCLFQIVTFQDVSWSGSNFIPLKEMLRYEFGSRHFYRNVFGNMLLFMPYGFFASFYLKIKKPLPAMLLVLIASSAIEVTQLIIGRVFDIDDIILNILGGTIGFLIYHIIDKIEDRLPAKLKKDWIFNVAAIILLIGVGCVMFI